MRHLLSLVEPWRKVSLQSRLAIALSILLLGAAGLQTHLSIRSDVTIAQNQLTQEIRQILPLLAPQVAEQVVTGDYATIRQLLKAQVEHRHILQRIVWTGLDGRSLAVEGETEEVLAPRWFSAYLGMTPGKESQRIVLGGVDYGELAVHVTHIPMENALWEQFVRQIWQLTIAIFLTILIIALIMRASLTVVRSLADNAQRLSLGNYHVRIPERGSPELKSAAHSFNEMATRIGDLISTLSLSQSETREQLHFTQELIEALPIPIFFKDREGAYLGVNRAWESFFGIPRGQALGRTVHDVYTKDPDFAAYQHSKDALLWNRPGSQAYDAIITPSDKNLHNVVYYQATYTDTEGKVLGLIGTIVDITESKAAEEKLTQLAYYDSLTGLPNRLLLMERLKQAMAEASHNKRNVAILYIDLDRFKYINDSLGHDVGDVFLKVVSQRLVAQARPNDVVSRFGGDEFTMLIKDVDHIDHISSLAQRIVDSLAQPLHVDGRELFAAPSIGVTMYPQDAADAEGLLKNADIAMYQAKDQGGSTYRFYTAEMNAQSARRLAIEMGLRYALDRNEISLVYQPQVDLTTGCISGAEALLRWYSPDNGEVPPCEFIPLAEESGMILRMGEWALRNACAQVRAWHKEGFANLRIAVNLSSRQIQQGALLPQVRTALRQTGLPGRYLELELTESMLIAENDSTHTAFDELHDLGVRFSIDDFGTGYSSLSYLKCFPIDAIKIDRMFLHGVPDNLDSSDIVAAIIAMARSLSIGVIGEGVETIEQLDFLRRHGCDSMQGYYFSKPISAVEFTALLKEGRKLSLGGLAPTNIAPLQKRQPPR